MISNKNGNAAIFTDKTAQEGAVVAIKLKQHAVTINDAVQPNVANTDEITRKLTDRMNLGKTVFASEVFDPTDVGDEIKE